MKLMRAAGCSSNASRNSRSACSEIMLPLRRRFLAALAPGRTRRSYAACLSSQRPANDVGYQFLVEPRADQAPSTLRRRTRNIHRFSGIFDTQASEYTPLANPAATRMVGLQVVEQLVQRHEVVDRVVIGKRELVGLDVDHVAAPLGGLAAFRVVHQDLPHRSGCGGIEVLAIGEAAAAVCQF